MLPYLSSNNTTNKNLADPIFYCDIFLRFLSTDVFNSYLPHLLFGKLIINVSMPFGPSPISPALSNHISKIFFLRSNKKVAGPNTDFIVALMTNAFSFWDWAKSQLIRKSVSKVRFSKKTNDAISGSISAASPFPASTSFFNGRPKVFTLKISHFIAYIKGDAPCQPRIWD